MTGPPFTLSDALAIHAYIIEQTGGSPGLRDSSALDSALASPFATFQGQDLHSTVIDKAAALGFAVIHNHPFIDGNKRTALVLLVTLLRRQGLTLSSTEDEAEVICLQLASGNMTLTQLKVWIASHTMPYAEL